MLENICVSLETAKALFEAGIVIESTFYWWECSWGNHQNTEWHLGTKFDSDLQRMNWAWLERRYPAPTAEELFNLIPLKILYKNYVHFLSFRRNYSRNNKYELFGNFGGKTFDNKRLCELLADLLLWLKKEGYLDV
jgi:hypothetical protein